MKDFNENRIFTIYFHYDLQGQQAVFRFNNIFINAHRNLSSREIIPMKMVYETKLLNYVRLLCLSCSLTNTKTVICICTTLH